MRVKTVLEGIRLVEIDNRSAVIEPLGMSRRWIETHMDDIRSIVSKALGDGIDVVLTKAPAHPSHDDDAPTQATPPAVPEPVAPDDPIITIAAKAFGARVAHVVSKDPPPTEEA